MIVGRYSYRPAFHAVLTKILPQEFYGEIVFGGLLFFRNIF
jgi:hypothetical protein